jgi:hypothetical protein
MNNLQLNYWKLLGVNNMNKKISTIGIAAILMLAMSIITAVGSDIDEDEKKESPLYAIRMNLEIRDKIDIIFNSVKTRFLGNRIFFIPHTSLIKGFDNLVRYRLVSEEKGCPDKGTTDLPCSLPETIPTVPEQETCGWHKTCMWGCVINSDRVKPSVSTCNGVWPCP